MNSSVERIVQATLDGTSAYIDRFAASIAQQLKALEDRISRIKPGEKGDKGEDGEPGKQGERGPAPDLEVVRLCVAEALPKTLDNVREVLRQHIDTAISEMRDDLEGRIEELLMGVRASAKDGEPGPPGPKGDNGEPGKDFRPEDAQAIIETVFARSWLELERRATDQHTRFLERLPAPKDGKDGANGLGFDDLTIEHDGERKFTFKMARGEQSKEFAFTFPVVLDRGVFKAGQYEKGDFVSWDGSGWIAQQDTEDKPGTSSAWRLAVKRGRDGKDAAVPVTPSPVRLK